ncbi:SGNH hydrolase-type esterase domain-containing protein [Phlyctochytrium arcticum]|nr:SGNH hydrolase-type esterase domain-containing protein [Phlyctochytrium arcticum]
MLPTAALSFIAVPFLRRVSSIFASESTDSASYMIQEQLRLHGPLRTVVAFGDSLTSSTNGRWTDGPVWVEHVVEKLNIPHLENYAWGGATSGAPYRGYNPSLDQQVDTFLKRHVAPKKLEEVYPPHQTVYALWAGGNDYFHVLRQNGMPSSIGDYQKALGDVMSVPARVISNIETAMSDLMASQYRSRHFLVFNLPALDAIPVMSQVHPMLRTVVRQWVAWHNSQLASSIKRFAAKHRDAGVTVTLVDAHKLMEDAIEDPKQHGFADVQTPKYGVWGNAGTGRKSGGGQSQQGDAHLFYDGLHPSGWAHVRLADKVMTILGEQKPIT